MANKATIDGKSISINIPLGSEVKDGITGFTGIAIAVTVFINGTTRYSVKPRKIENGRTGIAVWFDSEYLEVVGTGVHAANASNSRSVRAG